MTLPLLQPEGGDEKPRAQLPPTHGRFTSIGSLVSILNCRTIFETVSEISAEQRRAGRSYWTFEQYERLFAVAMTPERKWSLVLTAIVKLRKRYLAARAAHLSPWQFAEQERRLRESDEANEARLRRISAEAEARSKEKGYRSAVSEFEQRERARREARENVERENPTPRRAGRVAKARPAEPARSYFEPTNEPQEYLPPEMPF